ncbi:pimeloyl-ACP methyl ester carboxylesterase [Pedobacter sp. UYP30]|uniref:alpha/beta hydrolase family protein n=1 Tax=Pedobacter sp. UYP30 TaxID=1756400 RepID=UPI0033964846
MITKTNFTLKGADDKLILGDITVDHDLKHTPVILFVHGFKGYKDWGAHNLVANYFAENGYRYLKFNFSHSGVPSDNPKDLTDLALFGQNTFSKELFDLKQVVDFIAQTCGSETEINLIGHSRGGGLSIIAAANDDRISKLITWSAIEDFKNLWKPEQEAMWEKEGVIYITNSRTKVQMPLNVGLLYDYRENPERLNIVDAAKRIKAPWLIVNGTKDQSVSVENAKKLHQANPKSKLEIVLGADHVYGASQPYLEETLPLDLQEVCEKCLVFFRENN